MAKIMLIDDDETLRSTLRLMLERMGHAVIEACDGREAIQLYECDPADLVITDLVMPEQEGLETIRELRRKNPELKIIAMSGGVRNVSVDFLKIARHLGAQRTVAKPFTNQELMLALEAVLPPARPT